MVDKEFPSASGLPILQVITDDPIYYIFRVTDDLQHKLIGQYHDFGLAIKHLQQASFALKDRWYITQHNQLMAHMFSHFVGVKDV